MALYVFALVDQAPAGRAGSGLSGALSLRKVAGAIAVVERRADVPPAEFGTLQRHQTVVADLAGRVPAILPVRFGTLLEPEALEEALAERDEDVAEAFDVVRGRVQFTWRRKQQRRDGQRRRGKPEGVMSGSEYLRRAARAARPAPPAVWRPLRSKVAPLVAAERYQPSTVNLPDSLYHLVDRGSAIRYSTMAAALHHANPALTMTGPWPPFAFAAELL